MVDRACCARPHPCPEDPVQQPDRTSSRPRTGTKNIPSLIDTVWRRKNLAVAWERVHKKHGSAGIDHVPIEQCALRKVYDLDLGQRKLRRGTEPPYPVKRVEIDTPDGGRRTLGRPTVLDRVVQQALVPRMEPIFAALLAACACGYRQGRSPHDAMGKGWRALQAGYPWRVAAALRAYFDPITHTKLVDLIANESSDGRVLHLGGSMRQAGVMGEGAWQPTRRGVPQGGVASPLWSKISLTPFERSMTAMGGQLTGWADDCVIVWKTRQEAQRALTAAPRVLQDALGVVMHPQKTRIGHMRQGCALLGSKVKQGKGHRVPDAKRPGRSNPQNL